MSEMADMYMDMREASRQIKAKNLKLNSEIVLFLGGFFQFGVTQHTEFHFSLYHPSKGRLDYWPSTKKAAWFKNKRMGKAFKIKDIEKFIFDHFK